MNDMCEDENVRYITINFPETIHGWKHDRFFTFLKYDWDEMCESNRRFLNDSRRWHQMSKKPGVDVDWLLKEKKRLDKERKRQHDFWDYMAGIDREEEEE